MVHVSVLRPVSKITAQVVHVESVKKIMGEATVQNILTITARRTRLSSIARHMM